MSSAILRGLSQQVGKCTLVRIPQHDVYEVWPSLSESSQRQKGAAVDDGLVCADVALKSQVTAEGD